MSDQLQKLRALVREVVREEVARQVPRLVERYLAESLVSKVVSEQLAQRGEDSLSERLAHLEEPTAPAPLPRPRVPSGLDELFEGTRPAPQRATAGGTSQQQFGEGGIPLELLTEKLGVKFPTANRRVQEPTSVDEGKLKLLELRRKMLDSVVSEG